MKALNDSGDSGRCSNCNKGLLLRSKVMLVCPKTQLFGGFKEGAHYFCDETCMSIFLRNVAGQLERQEQQSGMSRTIYYPGEKQPFIMG